MDPFAAFLISSILIIIILSIFLINFYRDPKREIPKGRNIVSPADGKILSILATSRHKGLINKGFIGRIESLTKGISKKCFIISIFMSPLDVHVNRSPIEGEVISVRHYDGRFFAAFNLKKSLMNEKNEIIIKNNRLGKIKVIQIAGFLARRIVCSVKRGDRLYRGKRIGKIVLGSQVSLIVPQKVKLRIKQGQKVFAGKTILAVY